MVTSGSWDNAMACLMENKEAVPWSFSITRKQNGWSRVHDFHLLVVCYKRRDFIVRYSHVIFTVPVCL